MQRFLFTNCTLVHNELFVVGAWGGLPAKMNPYNGKIEYFNDMKNLIVRQNSVVIDFMDYYQGKIYALDSNGKDLVVFDLEEHQCQYLSINCNYQRERNFVAFERYQQDYYIFSKYNNRILMLNTETNEIADIAGCLDDIDEIQCACRIKNSVWLLPQNANEIYCYDLSKRTKKIYKLKKTIHNCIHAIFKDNCIYILNTFGLVYIWNIKEMELSEITDLETECDEKLSMIRIIYAGNRLILLPASDSVIKILDLLTRKIQIYNNYPTDFYDQTSWVKYYGYCEDEKYYYFAMCASNYLLRIEKRTGKLIWTRPQNLKGKEIQFHLQRGETILEESAFCELFDLIVFLPERIKKQDIVTDVGKNIYTSI